MKARIFCNRILWACVDSGFGNGPSVMVLSDDGYVKGWSQAVDGSVSGHVVGEGVTTV